MSSLPRSAFARAPRLQVANDEYDAVREGRVRIRIGGVIFLAALGVVIVRLSEVALLTPNAQARILSDQVTATRADITDRNGEILATTLTTYSLVAEPRRIWDVEETTQALLSVRPNLDAAELRRKLGSERYELWVERGLTPREKQEIFDLGQPGLVFREEPRRTYPKGALAAHVVGFTNVDLEGLGGAEKALHERISTENAPPVALSIDLRVQHALEDELAKGLEKFEAKTIAGVVLDVKTGEIMAMASLPDFDPNQPGQFSPQEKYNHAAMSTYELGSVFKPLTAALALETQTSTTEQYFPVQKGFTIQRKFIRDDHPSKIPMQMQDVIAESSNRGTALMALEAGAMAQQSFLGELGLFNRVPYELGESAAPQVQSNWQDITTVTVSYGHGMSVTPLAFTAAIGALFNDGAYVQPTILKRDASNPAMPRRVMRPDVAETVQGFMRYTVTDGTGRKADIKGYGVMGKTGTADKPGIGGYDGRRLVTSFIAGFPYADPRYAVLVTFDEPKAVEGTWGYATAGWNAAPTNGNIIRRIAPMLGVEKLPVEETMSPYTKPEGAD